MMVLGWGSSSQPADQCAAPGSNAGSQGEAESLREQVEELQAKLDALRMADYREQMRASCAETAARHATQAEGASRQTSFDYQSHGRCDDEDAGVTQLEDMYDFSRFMPPPTAPEPSAAVSMSIDTPERPSQCVTAADAETMTEAPHVPAGPLANVEAAVAALRGQLEQLERDLQQDARTFEPLFSGLDTVEKEVAQAQAQQPNVVGKQLFLSSETSNSEPDPLEGMTREHVMELAQVCEDLTQALEASRLKERQAIQKLEQASRQLAEELQQRASIERRFSALEATAAEHDKHAQEVSRLQILLRDMEKQRDTNALLAKTFQERAERVEAESGLHKALAQRGKSLLYRHLEV